MNSSEKIFDYLKEDIDILFEKLGEINNEKGKKNDLFFRITISLGAAGIAPEPCHERKL